MGCPQHFSGVSSILSRDLLCETSYDLDALCQYVQMSLSFLLNIVDSVRHQTGGQFFLDAPGGTGKIFVIKIILAKVRLGKDIALTALSSGFAATLLPCGKTAHSTFKLPFDLVKTESPICNISQSSEHA